MSDLSARALRHSFHRLRLGVRSGLQALYQSAVEAIDNVGWTFEAMVIGPPACR
jgi:hypothetical protein